MVTETLGYQLSPQQKRQWKIQQSHEQFCAQASLSIHGALDSQRLRAALQRLVDRHEVLRTGFQIGPDAESSLQVVGTGNLEWNEHDLNGFSKEQIAERLEQVQSCETAAVGASLRGALLKIEEQNCLLVLTLSPLCADQNTFVVLTQHLAKEYASPANGVSEQEPIQYAQFSEWQNELAESGQIEKGRAYWRKQIDVALEGLRLPFESSENTAFTPERVPVFLNAETVSAVARIGAGSDKATVLLAAWTALLWRLTRQPHMVVTRPFDSREHEDLNQGMGLYARQLPIRCDCSAQVKFSDLLAQVEKSTREARQWQYHSPVADGNLWPTQFPFNFSYIETPQSIKALGVELSVYGIKVRNEEYKLKLEVREGEGGWKCELHYDAARFSRKDVECLAEQYTSLLESAVKNPEASVSELDINSAEQKKKLQEWRGSGKEQSTETITAWFERQAARSGESTAIVFGPQELSYRELNERANQLAHYLRSRGVRAEKKVGLLLERGIEKLVAILGVLKAGGAYVPMDPEYPQERMRMMMEDTRARVVITQKKLEEKLAAFEGLETRIVVLEQEKEQISRQSKENLSQTADSENTAYVIYTSGSTGKPKGVVITQNNVVRLFQMTEGWLKFSKEDVWSLFHNYAFDVSVWEMWGAWLYGGKLVVISREETRSPEQFYEVLKREQVTILSQTPSAFRQLQPVMVEREKNEELGKDLAIRAVVFAGEALNPALVADWAKKYPETEMLNLYGITETTVHSTYKKLSKEDIGQTEKSPIGVGFGDLRLYVMTEKMVEAGIWEQGEIYVAGAGLARGYLNRPELTAERFLPEIEGNGAGTGERMYKSGDLARRRGDGELEYVGRGDDQVKIRGYRVELGEIEAAVRKQGGVKETAVLVKGEGAQRRLVCYVFPEAGQEVEVERLREQLLVKLPEYMVPAVFVVLDKMPLTGNGKLDKRALPEPGNHRPKLKQQFVAADNEEEKILAEIWSEVLGIKDVGVHDNYFVLGGDSIRSVRIVALANKRGLPISLQDLFQNQTISELARKAGTQRLQPATVIDLQPFNMVPEEDKNKLPEGLEDAYPLGMLQGGMLFHLEMDPDASVYHNVVSFNIEAAFDAEAFQQAVDYVVDRHGILRTSFDMVSFTEPLQLVHKSAKLNVDVIDLRDVSFERQQIMVAEHVDDERRKRFDITKPPLLRFQIHRRTENSFNFTITDCHAILDGWSLTSTISEVFNHYFALLNHEPQPIEPPIALKYRDFVHLERQAVESKEFQDFWSRKLKDCSPNLIPRWPFADRPVGEFHDPLMRFTLTPELLDTLNQRAQAMGVSLKAILLATHMKVLSMLTGQNDVLTGLSCHGRPEAVDGDRVRGNFLNTIPLRVALEDGSWEQLAKQIFQEETELLPYQRYPLAALQKVWGRQTYIETLFATLNFHSLEKVARSGKMRFLSQGNIDTSETNFTLAAIFWISPFPEMLPSTLFLQFTKEMGNEQISTIGDWYMAALNAIAKDPGQNHGDLNLLGLLAEQDRLLLEQEIEVSEMDSSFSF